MRNRKTALNELQSRLNAKAAAGALAEITEKRRAQLGVTIGERSDKIRTYNFAQNRVTDHRVPGLTLNNKLSLVLAGGPQLDLLMTSMQAHEHSVLVQSVLDKDL